MGLKALSILPFIVLLGLAVSFSGCGPSNNSRKIIVDAGFKVRAKKPYNLSETLTQFSMMPPMMVAPAGTCLQDQIQLVVHDPITDQIVSTNPVLLYANTNVVPASTPFYTNSPTDIDKAIDWMKNYSILEGPLELNVPRGSNTYDIGLMGHFFSPKDTLNNLDNTLAADGICDQGTTALPLQAQGSSSIFGKTTITPSQFGTVPLNVQVVHGNPTGGTFSLSNHPGYFAQFDKDFTDTSAAKTPRLKTVSYLNGLIKSRIDNIGGFTYYFPSIFPAPYQLTFEVTTATYVSTAMGPTVCGGCAAIPNPVMVSGTDSFSNGVVGAINVVSGTIAGTVIIATNIVNFTATSGVCTSTLTVTGTNSNGGDNGVVSFNITSPQFVGAATLVVSGYTLGATTFSAPCPQLIPNGGYGIIQQ